jgi:hypothetical protein
VLLVIILAVGLYAVTKVRIAAYTTTHPMLYARDSEMTASHEARPHN